MPFGRSPTRCRAPDSWFTAPTHSGVSHHTHTHTTHARARTQDTMSSVTALSAAAAPSARRVVARTHRHQSLLHGHDKPTRVRRQHPQQDCVVGGRAITRGVAVSNAALIHDEHEHGHEHEHVDDEIVEASSSKAAAAAAAAAEAVVGSRRKLALATAATVAAAIGTNVCGTSPFPGNNVASALARGHKKT